VRQSPHAILPIMQASWRAREQRRLLIAAVLLGVGLGGFVDGIVLHQVLQWHHLVSTPVPPDSLPNLEHNTFWDGMFHVGTWAVTVAGQDLARELLVRNGAATDRAAEQAKFAYGIVQTTGGGIGPNRSVTSWRNAARQSAAAGWP